MAPQFSMLSPSLCTGGDGSGRLRLCSTNLFLPTAPPCLGSEITTASVPLFSPPHAEGATPLSAAITGSNKLALSLLKLYSPSISKMLMDWNSKAPPSLWDWDPQPDWPVDAASSPKNTVPNESSLLPLNLAAAAAAAQEPPIGLKLGKRTYFEDVCGGAAPATAKSIPTSSAAKRSKASSLQTFRCQVEGCHADLTGAKDYYRKHHVCETHSKSPRVVVAGQERRFCQQCSRFHDLAEFDEMKKSCRKRLLDHNARRRKPQPGTISFGSAVRLPLPFYDNRQQMNLLASRAPFGQIRPSVGSTLEGSVDFKLADMKGPWMKSTKVDSEGQLLHSGSELSNDYSTLHHDLDKIFPFKTPTAEILNQGPHASGVDSSLNREPDLRRAFSLLSTNSWVSAEPVPTTSVVQPVHTNQSRATQHTIQTVNSAFDYWQHEQPSQVPHFPMHNNGSQFPEFQLLKSPFGTTFFDSREIQ